MNQGNMQCLLDIMRRLRDPEGGCPWDREQTYRSIVPHTLEEAYEVADAIERDDYGDLRDELGDLLFQVVFYAQLASEEGRFDFNDIVQGICDKLERRHPHVFGDQSVSDAADQTRQWEQLKAEERQRKAGETASTSVLDGITTTLPAVSVAHKLQSRAARIGFDWPEPQGVLEKVREELSEIEQAWAEPDKRTEEIGDLLFTCVNLARHAGVDAESSLRLANRKFDRRFRAMEQRLLQRGATAATAGPEELEAHWMAVKAGETH